MWQDRRYAHAAQGTRFERARVTTALVGAMAALHVAGAILQRLDADVGVQTATRWGATWRGWTSWELWRPFTAAFVHADWLHLLGAGLALWMTGAAAEPVLGRRAVAEWFLVGAVVGSAAPAVWRLVGVPDATTVGAGAGTAGVLAVTACRAPDMPIFGPRATARRVLIAFAAADIAALFLLRTRDARGVAVWDAVAHLLSGGVVWTALRGWPELLKPAWRRLRRHQDAVRGIARLEQELGEEQELDRLLEKIRVQGAAALSDDERAFLERASEKRRGAGRG